VLLFESLALTACGAILGVAIGYVAVAAIARGLPSRFGARARGVALDSRRMTDPHSSALSGCTGGDDSGVVGRAFGRRWRSPTTKWKMCK
jgi:hypothetical protein